jgi:hypothetical protein
VPTTLIPTTYQLPVLALLLVGGLIAWAAGYRLFRFVLTIFGFYIGALAASALLGPGDRTLLVFAALGGGAVGALIMFFGYFVGVALVGAGSGALSVHIIWSRLGSDPHAFVVILAAVAGAAAAMALQRYVIIIATAFSGGWTMLWSARHVSDSGGALEQLVDRRGDAVQPAEQHALAVQVIELDRAGGAREALPGRAAGAERAVDRPEREPISAPRGLLGVGDRGPPRSPRAGAAR